MGQRSQIYVKVDGELTVANYYQWNYGTRMVSRARYGLEFIKEYIQYGWYFKRNYADFEKFRRIWDINFDYKDMVISSDIFKEWEEEFKEENFKDFVFDMQDNNDGKFFVEIVTESKIIKYCFTDYDGNLLDAEQYMYWDQEEWMDEDNQYITKSERKTCIRNIKKINKLATLMTEKELEEFKNIELLSVF